MDLLDDLTFEMNKKNIKQFLRNNSDYEVMETQADNGEKGLVLTPTGTKLVPTILLLRVVNGQFQLDEVPVWDDIGAKLPDKFNINIKKTESD